jgi:GNAT superfamily N-acetyltransferase
VPLDLADVEACAALSRSVGWNDSPADWRVLFACARGFGLRAPGGRLVAQCLLCALGPVARVAKMVVRDGHRGAGLGRRPFGEALAAAREGGFAHVALLATEAGRNEPRRRALALGDARPLRARRPGVRRTRRPRARGRPSGPRRSPRGATEGAR